jgi:hypothetical protein
MGETQKKTLRRSFGTSDDEAEIKTEEETPQEAPTKPALSRDAATGGDR